VELMDTLFRASGLFYRICPTCDHLSHKEIYYKRITPIPDDFSFFDSVIYTWSSNNNILNVDFYLYSSYDDLKNDVNRWQYCNYDDVNVGFPRDCGLYGPVPNTWTSSYRDGGATAEYYIYYTYSDIFKFFYIPQSPTGTLLFI